MRVNVALLLNTNHLSIIYGPKPGDMYIKAYEGEITLLDQEPEHMLQVLWYTFNAANGPRLPRSPRTGDILTIDWKQSWVIEDIGFRKLPTVIRQGRFELPITMSDMQRVRVFVPEHWNDPRLQQKGRRLPRL